MLTWRRSRWLLLLALLVLVRSWLGGDYLLHAVNIGGIYILAAFGMDILFGRARMLSLGNAAMFAIGAYTSAAITIYTSIQFPVAALVAGIAAGLIGLVVALPALRMTGIYLGVATYAFVLIVHQLALEWDKARAENGLEVPVATIGSFRIVEPETWFWVWVVVAGTLLALGANLLRSRTGRSFAAIADSEIAAQAMGISILRTKLTAFGVAGFLTGIGGAMYAHYLGFIYPDSFELNLTLMLIAMPIIGGSATIPGAVIGAMFVSLLPELMRLLPGDLKEFQSVGYGALLLLMLVFEPTGIMGILGRIRRVLRPDGDVSTPVPPPDPLASSSHGEGAVDTPIESIISMPSSPPSEVEPPSSAVLECRSVTIRFGGLVALNDVSFSVPERSIFGLIGPNGAGKSTLLNCISGFYTPTAGRILYRGRDVTTDAPHVRSRMGIGRTFQNLELFGGSDVRRNVLIARHSHLSTGLLGESIRTPKTRRAEREAEAHVDEILRRLDLQRVADRVVTELPYAMQKRVELARSLALEPDLLLLDEPATGMNRSETEELAERIRAIRADFGITVVLIEHNMQLVMNLCEELVVLNFGTKIGEGTPSVVQQDPAVIEAYLGRRPVATPAVGT